MRKLNSKLWLALALVGALSAVAAVPKQFSTTTTVLAADADACTTAGDTDCTVFGLCSATSADSAELCSSATAHWKVAGFPSFAITVRNSGAQTAKDVLIEFSDNGSNWELWNSTVFDELLAGEMRSIQVNGNSRRFVRVEGNSTVGTTVVASISVNDG